MMYFNPNHNSNTGFSLVETLVAIAILLIIIVGPMSIATNSANSTSFANQQVMAYFLAQEGLELAQKGRDDFLLTSFAAGTTEGENDAAWDEFTTGSVFSDCFDSAGCGLEIEEGPNGDIEVIDCLDVTDCRLHLPNATNERSQYTYDGSGEITDFTRVVTMEELPDAGKDVLVTSVVSWRTGNQIAVQSTTAITYLYNVYGR